MSKRKRTVLIKRATVAHCHKCYAYQVIAKRHDSGRLRLSCGHRIRPRRIIDVSA